MAKRSYYADGIRHIPFRSSCKRCKQPNHDETEDGNTCRFHKHGKNAPRNVFCYTHHSMKNPAVRMYCLPSGKPKAQGKTVTYDDPQQINKKHRQIKEEIQFYKDKGNTNMVKSLNRDLDKLEVLEDDIRYYKKYDNQSMVKLLRRDVNRLG